MEEQVDGLEQQEAFVRGVVENYDRVSIDPIMQALPERDRAALMADLPDGLDGRKQLVTAALARLKVVWQAEAVRKVNGQAPRQNGNGSNQILPPQNPPPSGPAGAGGRRGRAGGLRIWQGPAPAGHDERLDTGADVPLAQPTAAVTTNRRSDPAHRGGHGRRPRSSNSVLHRDDRQDRGRASDS